MKPVAQCKVCKKTLSTDEIEVGTSLVCPRCDPKADKKTKPETERSSENNTATEET